MNKADYSRIAGTFDSARSISNDTIEMWLAPILHDHSSCNSKVVDIGCGTGRFSIPLAYHHNYNVTGVDSSKEMLSKAKQKDTENRIEWICCNVEKDLSSTLYDVIFISHLIHHLDSPKLFLRNCFRICNNEGSIYIRHGAIEQIQNDVVHTFFPAALEIDRKRTPTIADLEKWIIDAGFDDIETMTMKQRTFCSAEERLETVRLKSTSVLTLIPETEFETGIERLKAYIEKNNSDPWLLTDDMSLTIGHKRS